MGIGFVRWRKISDSLSPHRFHHSGKRRQAARLEQSAPQWREVFSTVELIGLLADPDRLDEATKTISQFWKRKNARRNGETSEKAPNSNG